MAWNYDPTQLGESELMQVRLEIDDVDPDDQKFQDEELEHFIGVERNLWGAAARAAEVLSRRYLAHADVVSLGRNLRIESSKRATQYAEVAKALRAKSLGTVLPWVGGRSIDEKLAARADADAVQPLFTKHMFGNPRSGGTSSDPDDESIGRR